MRRNLPVALLLGEGVACEDANEVAAHLARATDGIAYYIQHIVAEMGLQTESGTIAEWWINA